MTSMITLKRLQVITHTNKHKCTIKDLENHIHYRIVAVQQEMHFNSSVFELYHLIGHDLYNMWPYTTLCGQWAYSRNMSKTNFLRKLSHSILCVNLREIGPANLTHTFVLLVFSEWGPLYKERKTQVMYCSVFICTDSRDAISITQICVRHRCSNRKTDLIKYSIQSI